MQELLPFERINYNILVKKESETNPNYSILPESRTIDSLINYGIININKPSGPTSHQVSEYVQNILNIKKAGHSGTLDPGVTGVLPIALGKATRIVETLLKTGKEYICLMHLHKKINQSKIYSTFDNFVGTIDQLPPIRSAVKRQLRKREIYYLKILEIKDQDVLFKVGCEAGTYIRKLCSDIGKKLNTNAHMQELVRTKVASFNDKNWHSLHDLKDAYEFYKNNNDKELKNIILPIEATIQHLPKIWVFDNTVNSLCHGSDLYTTGISKLNDQIQKNDTVAILTLKDELVCLGQSYLSSKEILGRKALAIKTQKVFMECNVYPKFKK